MQANWDSAWGRLWLRDSVLATDLHIQRRNEWPRGLSEHDNYGNYNSPRPHPPGRMPQAGFVALRVLAIKFDGSRVVWRAIRQVRQLATLPRAGRAGPR